MRIEDLTLNGLSQFNTRPRKNEIYPQFTAKIKKKFTCRKVHNHKHSSNNSHSYVDESFSSDSSTTK